MLRLITIPISHYCEKARWALDRAGIAYREERHVQLVHRVAARRAGGGSTVPVLVTDGGVLGESQAILTWVDQRTPAGRQLFPAESRSAARADVDALCRRFDEQLGPTGRRLIYVHVLEGDSNGGPHPEPAAYAAKFSGTYSYRTIEGRDWAQPSLGGPRGVRGRGHHGWWLTLIASGLPAPTARRWCGPMSAFVSAGLSCCLGGRWRVNASG